MTSDSFQSEPALSEAQQGILYKYPIHCFNALLLLWTLRLNQPRGQCSENHLKCITRWEGRDGVTFTIFFQPIQSTICNVRLYIVDTFVSYTALAPFLLA